MNPRAPRLYAPNLSGDGADLSLGEEAAAHARVLRLTGGDEVELFDGLGRVRMARIASLSRGGLRCAELGEIRRRDRGRAVVLVQGAPKGSKLDEIVRMTTELGVSEIRPAWCARCVVRVDDERGSAKVPRLRRVAIEAARQSEQDYLPEIAPPRALAQVLAEAPADAVRLACVERSARPWPAFPAEVPVWVVVGPEGGWDASDLELLQSHGFLSVGLGRSILRTETAAVVGVAWAMSRIVDGPQHR